jgi:predicted ABC-type transport system involved in lysophospholipase L1 biosynthesis ATPase subunit
VTGNGQKEDVLKLVDGLKFAAGPDSWFIEPQKIAAGTWVALVPNGQPPVVDPSGALAWILATMAEPVLGTVELLGRDVYRLDELTRQRLRARIGFVHGYGGLISNRTVRENIGLPVSVHGGLSADAEEALINKIVEDFALQDVADQKPHEMDGSTRWRVCLARALVLSPKWLVLEGLGSWEMDRGAGEGWTYLVREQQTRDMATVICLPRQNPGFESWFTDVGGIIVRYDRSDKIEREKADK